MSDIPICQYCGQELIRRPKERQCEFLKRKFCNQVCHGKSNIIQTEIKFCALCGKELIRKPREGPFAFCKRQFCDPVCANASRKGKPLRKEHREKVGNGNRGKIFSKERCRRISEAKRGKKRAPFSDEARRNMGLAHVGKPQSPESVRKRADNRRGKPGKSPSIETRRLMSERLNGKQFSDETRRRISEAKRGKPGKSPSQETREKTRNAHLERMRDPEELKKYIARGVNSSCGQLDTVRIGSKAERALRLELDKLGVAYIAGKRLANIGYPDFRFPNHHLIVQVDGSYWHGTDKQKAADKRQDSLYAELGYRVIRICSEEVLKHPHKFAMIIVDELNAIVYVPAQTCVPVCSGTSLCDPQEIV